MKLAIVEDRYILCEFVRKRVKTQYRNSFFGMFWTVLNPLLTMLVMWLAFSQILGRNDPLYPIYLLTGNIMFSCLSSATNGGLQSIVGGKGYMTKMKMNPYLFPLSTTLASVVNFFFSLIALLLIMLGMQIFGGHQLYSWKILTIFLMLPAFVLFEYGIALFLSTIYVFFRDIKYLYSVFMTLWMYITPLFYKEDVMKPGSFSYKIIKLNPMYYFIRFFRDAAYMGWSEYPAQDLLVLYGLGFLSVGIGYLVYRLLKKKFMTFI